MTHRWIIHIALLVLPVVLPDAPAPGAGEPGAGSRPLSEVLAALGAPDPAHRPLPLAGATAERGFEILTRGRTLTAAGDSTPVQSTYFRCIDCHLLEREDPSLRVSDPGARFASGALAKQRLLPGVTLHGAVNRSTWYEGYERKYGALVAAARHDLREAIQLCSRECSQGRALEPWELEAVLAHLWTLELRIGDLDLASEELARVEAALAAGKPDPDVVALLREAYLDRTPSTFVAPAAFSAGPGDAAAGQAIFERACLACHGPGGPSRFDMTSLDGWDDVVHARRAGELLSAVREGVPPPEGRKGRYMPEYSTERLSDAQLRDLMAWIDGVEAAAGGAGAGASDSAGSTPPGGATLDPATLDPVLLQTRVQELMTASCGSCHGRKAGPEWIKFDYVEKLDRLAAKRSFVVPGDPDASKLYRMVAGLEKPAMPHKRAPLTPAEVALIRAWIAGIPKPAR